MKYIAIIPARGGSKRFKGKNIYPLCGKPLISYSILYAKNNQQINDTFVSTDSEDIKNVSIFYGAKVIDRPKELGGDYVSSAAVLKDAVCQLIEQGIDFDCVVLLQPTNPLRTKTLLAEGIKYMETGNYDSLCTFSRDDKKLGRIVGGNFVPWNYKFGQRSQDMEPLFYENGLLYISKKDLILQERIFGDNMYPLVVEHKFGEVDIDTIEDMEYAEYIMQRNYEKD